MCTYIHVPIIDLGNPNFSPAFAKADPSGGGMCQNVASYWLLGVCLEAELEQQQCMIMGTNSFYQFTSLLLRHLFITDSTCSVEKM